MNLPTVRKNDKPKLTGLQRKLVDTMLANKVSHTVAAKIMGKTHAWAYVTVHKAHVQEELERRTKVKLLTAAALSVDVVEELRDSADSEAVRLNAAKDLLDRGGFSKDVKDLTQVAIDDLTINIDLG